MSMALRCAQTGQLCRQYLCLCAGPTCDCHHAPALQTYTLSRIGPGGHTLGDWALSLGMLLGTFALILWGVFR